MNLKHIVAATDESDAGRQAVRVALELAGAVGARVTVMRAVQTSSAEVMAGIPSAPTEDGGPELERLERWLAADMPKLAKAPPMTTAVTFGLPGIEIARFAEHEGGDLLILGRKPRSRMARLLVGDTADAVARRSHLPCLFVPVRAVVPRKVLVAIDGSERGMVVLTAAAAFANALRAQVHVVTVEPVRHDEPADLSSATPASRTMRAAEQVRAAVQRELEVRRGDPAEQILAAVEERIPDVLVIGCHRGGPPGILEAGSTARRLAHTAPCAVLTIPL